MPPPVIKKDERDIKSRLESGRDRKKKKRERDLNLGLKVSFASYLLGNANKTVTMIVLTAIIS